MSDVVDEVDRDEWAAFEALGRRAGVELRLAPPDDGISGIERGVARRARRRAMGGTAAVLVLLLAGWIALRSRQATDPPVQQETTTVVDLAAPPDRIVYQGDGNDTVIVSIRSDGSGKMTPTQGVPGRNQLVPDWSPDGTRIAFVLANGSTDDLWTVGADGTGAAVLVDCIGTCQEIDDPAWSPDGTEVVFERIALVDGARVGTIESVNVETGRTTVWLTAPATDFFAGVRFSPDGSRIVFEQVHTDGTTLDAEITGVTLSILDLGNVSAGPTGITDAALFAATADWGPNSDLIVFSALPKAGAENPDLFTIRPDGTGLTRLTYLSDAGGFAAEPAWSSDGSTVYFSAGVDGAEGVLAKVSAAGGPVSPAFGTTYDVHGRHPRVRAG